LLVALGAVVVLAIAGYALFVVQTTSAGGVPPEAIATVNGRPILRTDFVTQLQTQLGVPFAEATPEQRQRVLDAMIAEELMVQRGLKSDLPSQDPKVRKALVDGVELQLFADVLARQPTQQQLKDYYSRHHHKYLRDGIMQFRDLVMPAGSMLPPEKAMHRATKAAKALRHGSPLDEVMREFGLQESRQAADTSQVEPEELSDTAAKTRFDAQVFHVASKLKAGETSKPFAAADGVHIVVMVKREPPYQPPFAEVSNEVWADLKKEAQDQARADHLRDLAARAEIRIAEGKWE
jgi:parvulin-like peptidyl-prolyl isomerase